MAEEGYKPNPEEQAELEKSRTLSDAEMLQKGAEYKVDESGESRLEVTKNQIRDIQEGMEANLMVEKYLPINEDINFLDAWNRPELKVRGGLVARDIGTAKVYPPEGSESQYTLRGNIDGNEVSGSIVKVFPTSYKKAVAIEVQRPGDKFGLATYLTDISSEDKEQRIGTLYLEKKDGVYVER